VSSSAIGSVFESVLRSMLESVLRAYLVYLGAYSKCTWEHFESLLESVSQAGWECAIQCNQECTSERTWECAKKCIQQLAFTLLLLFNHTVFTLIGV